METNKEEALKAKEYAEKRFAAKDYAGAKNFALKARSLFPDLDGISQMLATFDIYIASEARINGEVDFYSVLGLKPSSERSLVKKQYKKLAVLLHPDKNNTVGADGAFKLVSEAWTLLSDNSKRASYDLKRSTQMPSTYADAPPSFWTVCTSCQVQYEYLRKYVNKRLSCKNCRATFVAVELGTAPIDGSYPVSWSSSYAAENGYGGHRYNGGGGSYYHSGHGSEYAASNMSFQWGTASGYADAAYCANGYGGKADKKAKAAFGAANNVVPSVNNANGAVGCNGAVKTTRPYKKRKVELGGVNVNGNDAGINGNSIGITSPRFSGPNEPLVRQHPVPYYVDARSLLIEKARAGIGKKLEEMKLTAAAKNKVFGTMIGKFGGIRRKVNPGISVLEPKRSEPVTLVVPDPDFHDFDKDRTEECFKPKQVWALYDEEDGMPRLYCLIREVISLNPFKMQISYLGSKSDTEFGLVNWIQSGFTKSCGHFRASNSDFVEQVNIFSHLLSREKAGRGGCVRIYPRRGDIWALYRNWSPDWDVFTPCEVRHQYEMVEVLDEYSEEGGVNVAPLMKLEGFKTVYRRNPDRDSIWWIPRREMVRFSHQVPSWMLKDQKDLPEGCWDLDPAATPEEMLKEADTGELG